MLFWRIIGALIFRAIFIALGALLIAKFHVIIYVFGAFLVFADIKMAWAKDRRIHPERNLVLRLFRKIVGVTTDYRGSRLFVREGGRWLATPLFAVILLIESSDVILALDSIPAVFAVTKHPYIVFTANIFAILGLRSHYFVPAGVMRRFQLLHYGRSVILVFVGCKMILSDFHKIPIGASLGIVELIIAGSMIASVLWPRR